MFLSWSFCTACGYRTTTSWYFPQYSGNYWKLPDVQDYPLTCKSKGHHRGQCSLSCAVLEAGEEQKVDTYRVYVTPCKEDWPVFDPELGAYIDCDSLRPELESLMDLDKDDAMAIALVRIFVSKKQERGKLSKGNTFNWKKTKVVRGEWRTVQAGDHKRRLCPVDLDNMSTKAKAA